MAMSNINVRVDSDKKAKAQELFSSLGMDMSTAINLFLSQSSNRLDFLYFSISKLAPVKELTDFVGCPLLS